MSKKLNDKELSKINQNDLEFENAQLRLSVEKGEYRLLEMKQSILSYELEKKRQVISMSQKQEAEKRENRQSFLKTVAKKKGLTPGWGFDPYNGEIHEGE